MIMIKEFFNKIFSFFEKDIADEFRERITNPFFVALFFSWTILNWELVFILFNFDSGTTLFTKIDCIKEYINMGDSHWWRLFCKPILFALGAILLFTLLKQVALGINLLITNTLQPLIYKITDERKIVTVDKHEKIKKQRRKLYEAYQTLEEDHVGTLAETGKLRDEKIKAEEKSIELQTKLDEIRTGFESLSKKHTLSGFFEGDWYNEYILSDGSSGEEVVAIKDGNKYFAGGKYFFNIDMIEVNREEKSLKFRKVGIGSDKRNVVNDLKIISDSEYRGLEDRNIIITYTRAHSESVILNFIPVFSKNKIIVGEKTFISFKFKNNNNRGLVILSYQFLLLHNGIEVRKGNKHQFNFNVPGNTDKEKPFNLVDPLDYYFKTKDEEGIFDAEITLEYRIDDTPDIRIITRTARLIAKFPAITETHFTFSTQAPPQTHPHIDDHYYAKSLDLARNNYEIIITPKFSMAHWRFGVKFSKTELFLPAVQRHAANYPLFHIEKNQDYAGLKVTYYNEQNKAEFNKVTAISKYNEQPITFKISYENNTTKVDILDEEKKSILDSQLTVTDFKWCCLFAWGDLKNKFEFNSVIKEISKVNA